jgi:hypothetical protein
VRCVSAREGSEDGENDSGDVGKELTHSVCSVPPKEGCAGPGAPLSQIRDLKKWANVLLKGGDQDATGH